MRYVIILLKIRRKHGKGGPCAIMEDMNTLLILSTLQREIYEKIFFRFDEHDKDLMNMTRNLLAVDMTKI